MESNGDRIPRNGDRRDVSFDSKVPTGGSESPEVRNESPEQRGGTSYLRAGLRGAKRVSNEGSVAPVIRGQGSAIRGRIWPNVKKVADGVRPRSHLRTRLRRAREIRSFGCHFGRK